jgi:hypothetical protein
MLVMTHKVAPSASSKASKRAPNVLLSTSSAGKGSKPDSGSKSDSGSKLVSRLEGATRSVSAEKRQLMIAEAAYYLSERRGFGAGREMEDWLLAEQQVDAVLSGGEAAGAQAA